MLSNGNAMLSVGLQADLTANGRYIETVSGTPLDVLNLHHVPVDETDPVAALVASSAPTDRYDHHRVGVHNVAAGIAQILSNAVTFTRTSVLPVIKEVLATAEAAIEHGNAADRLDVTVLQHGLDDIYSDALLEQLGTGYDAANYNIEDPSIDAALAGRLVGHLTAQEFVETCGFSKAELNVELLRLATAALAKYGTFGDVLTAPGLRGVYTKDDLENHNTLLTFLALRGINNGLSTHHSHKDLTTTQQVDIAHLATTYGNKLALQLVSYDQALNRDDFFLQTDAETRTVHVFDTKYKDWLASGGSADLLGPIYSKVKGNPVQMGALVRDKTPEALQAEYDQALTLHTSQRAVQTTIDVRNVVQRTLSKQISMGSETPERQVALQGYVQELADVLPVNPDLKEYVREMVCRTIGRGTQADQLTAGMSAYVAANPDATREQALAASIQQSIAHWSVSQTVVKQV